MLPQRLKKGDTVGIIAPASPPKQEKLEKALTFLEEDLGLKIKLGKYVDSPYGYLAAKDEERLEDLHAMFLDNEVKAIICACGGYGTARIASNIDYEIIKNNPKIFWGYSDITFLHQSFLQKANLVTFHGPMLSSDIGLDNPHPISKLGFQQLFEPMETVYSEDFSSLDVLKEGIVRGEIVGGNLTLLVSSLGTPFELNTKGKILFLEDIDEQPYKVDRMLNQLKMAGKFEDANGIVIGDFHNCVPDEGKDSLSLEEVISQHVLGAGKPTMKGFKFGHCTPHIAIPHGTHAELNTHNKTLIIQPGVQ
ncbi:S66 peptidase family protein [Sutcliffiella rhizosphaerae]|uniref:Murein peptide carboxypeptidase n=1 Tax=Sutcliffiella rhizosphaerae TaxID=2880967 RepID=A0ABN8A5V0_9BACI|nr:LD-carboxypeptidase [Sutcliffiella rhizosphaerae]CAG9619277.1 putative murein peptide carboxypeptidase [Sutcliffiella rhizosphaerae]